MKLTVSAGGFEEHKKRALARAKKLDRGEKIEPEAFITFANPMQMVKVLTEKRVQIVQEVKTHDNHSISSLALALKRDTKSIRRDVVELERAGVIRTFEKINPGHGKVRIIRPAARKIQLSAAL